MKIGITGHRSDKLGSEYDYRGPVTRAIVRRIELAMPPSVDEMWSGLSTGADTIFAVMAIKMGIPLVAVIPFRGQELVWKPSVRELYYKLIEKSSRVIYVSEPGFANWKYQKRNEYTVDHIDKLFSVFDGSTGGTFNTIQYAKKVGRETVIINPKTLIL